MRVSLSWLSDYVDVWDIDPDELARRLTMAGLEVDAVEARNRGVEGVITARVVDVSPHPNADRLVVARVEAGGNTYTVVSGAPNVRVGDVVLFAPPGAKLPGLTLEAREFRGVLSQGMLVSYRELGLDDDLLPRELREGIYVFPPGTGVGMDGVQALALDDTVLVLDLTPNRADALSMLGVAYEVAALADREVYEPKVPFFSEEPHADVRVRVEAPADAPVYFGRLIEGVRIGPSPQWLVNRLLAAGIRPLNNVVDVTNYVMLEFGQPLHAFDADAITSGEVCVRPAREGERIVTLDGRERVLREGMLLITDGGRPVGIAGVMGGANSEITEGTTRVFLESAYFRPAQIRRTAQALGLRSEASRRFERGVDPGRVRAALDRAAGLIVQIAGGRVVGGIAGGVFSEADLPKPARIELSEKKLYTLLGTRLPREQVEGIFRRLGFPAVSTSEGWTVEVPTRRLDVRIPEDLVEEVARLVGYEEIPAASPGGVVDGRGRDFAQELRRRLRHALVRWGFFELYAYRLLSEAELGRFPALLPAGQGDEWVTVGPADALRVLHPMSDAHVYLRPSLLPSLLAAARYNASRGERDLRLFEVGPVFFPRGEGGDPFDHVPRPHHTPAREVLHLGVLLAGEKDPLHWRGLRRSVDVYDAKGVFEGLLALFGIRAAWDVVPRVLPGLHPGRTAELRVGGEPVGLVAEVHPEVAEEYGLYRPAVLEVDLERLFSFAAPEVQAEEVPRFPGVRRDLSFFVSEEVSAAALLRAARSAAGKELEDVVLFDVYRGEGVPQGKRSLALAFFFRRSDRTLTDEEVDVRMEAIRRALEAEFPVEWRTA
ncbi:phenylalanine--tRNA ligase subunit beta [Brockia lithotrophica]|uniref:Phenylalanine--tRNA ligase beta subunit n=1 Tax=Brockia lithotrophica TaxID=933949 RepID=A0A660KVZ5_9BACL|nr:phenylalanine--tRNA ligase subunit beta [Brockia lithotrophica]RKQ84612.1 phenylalanyl-tRNA synthetase beta subunit [Brockia lithotrophica]